MLTCAKIVVILNLSDLDVVLKYIKLVLLFFKLWAKNISDGQKLCKSLWFSHGLFPNRSQVMVECCNSILGVKKCRVPLLL